MSLIRWSVISFFRLLLIIKTIGYTLKLDLEYGDMVDLFSFSTGNGQVVILSTDQHESWRIRQQLLKAAYELRDSDKPNDT